MNPFREHSGCTCQREQERHDVMELCFVDHVRSCCIETMNQKLAVTTKPHIHNEIESCCIDIFESHLISVFFRSAHLSLNGRSNCCTCFGLVSRFCCLFD